MSGVGLVPYFIVMLHLAVAVIVAAFTLIGELHADQRNGTNKSPLLFAPCSTQRPCYSDRSGAAGSVGRCAA